MDSKKIIKISVLIVLFSCLVFLLNIKLQKGKTVMSGNDLPVQLDSIVFSTSSGDVVHLGERLYPKTSVLDSAVFFYLIESNILSINKVGDIIFVFLYNDWLRDNLNKKFPPISDSLFKYYYSKFYEVDIDDDIPYFVYLKNAKDNIQIEKNWKTNILHWNTAIIRDTIMTFFDGVKAGMEKEEVFSLLGYSK